MAAPKNKNKAEGTTPALEKALKVLRANKAEKVFLTADEYIFLKESDVRAYVGKDGSYTTVTEDSKPVNEEKPEEKPEANTKGKEEKADKVSDKVIDEHKKTEE